MSKQLRRSSFAAPAPSSTAVSRDFLSALLGRKATAHCSERMVALEPTCTLATACKISVMVPVHICRALQSWSSFFPTRYQNLCLLWVSCLPCPLWFYSETRCFFKAFQPEVFDNLLVLSQVYIKAQHWSRISSNGMGMIFSFRGVADLPSFPNIHTIFMKQCYRKGIVLYLSILWAKTESQAMGDAWEACIMSPH